MTDTPNIDDNHFRDIDEDRLLSGWTSGPSAAHPVAVRLAS